MFLNVNVTLIKIIFQFQLPIISIDISGKRKKDISSVRNTHRLKNFFLQSVVIPIYLLRVTSAGGKSVSCQ